MSSAPSSSTCSRSADSVVGDKAAGLSLSSSALVASVAALDRDSWLGRAGATRDAGCLAAVAGARPDAVLEAVLGGTSDCLGAREVAAPGNVDVRRLAGVVLGGARLGRGFAAAPTPGLVLPVGVFVRVVEALDVAPFPRSCLVGDLEGLCIPLASLGPGVGLPANVLALLPGASAAACLLKPLTP